MARGIKLGRKVQKGQSKDQAVVTKRQQGQQPQETNQKAPAVVQPKKFIKKSIEAKKRIQRSKTQKIFLLQAFRYESSWTFVVLGFSGNQYQVTLSTTVGCSCPDFQGKGKPCKHIYFIVTRVARNEETLDYFRSSSTQISQAAYDILDLQLTERLRGRMNCGKNKSKEIDLKDDVDCAICFTEMDKQSEDLDGCGTCRKYFHVVCITTWMNRNPACPMCRGNFVKEVTASIGGEEDALSKLGRIKLDNN